MSKLKKYKNILILVTVILIPTFSTAIFNSSRRGKLSCNYDVKGLILSTKCSGTFNLISYEYKINGVTFKGSESNFSCRLANRKIGDSVIILVSCEDDGTSVLFDESVAPGVEKRVGKWIYGYKPTK